MRQAVGEKNSETSGPLQKQKAIPNRGLRLSERGGGRKFDDVLGIVYDQSAGWSSLVARWAHNPKVGGSNPPPATNSTVWFQWVEPIS